MDRSTRSEFLNTVGLVQGTVVLLAVLLSLVLGVAPWRSISFAPIEIVLSVLGVLPMFLAFYVSGSLNDLVVRMFGRSLATLTVLDLALVSIVIGIGEEVLFRGVLQSALGRESLMFGIVTANALFAACHAVNKTYFVTAFFVGCYLSALMTAGDNDNLLRPIFAHSVYDFAAFLMIRREWRSRNTNASEEPTPEGETEPA